MPSTDSLSTNTTPIGLLKDLDRPIYLKVCYLQPSKAQIPAILDGLVGGSDKYSNALVFKQMSRILVNSDLYVVFQLFNGSGNELLPPVQTPYQAFTNNKRVWNRYCKFPINYNQLDIHAYIRVTLYEVVEAHPVVFGQGHLLMFNTDNSALRKGSYKVAIHTSSSAPIEYGLLPGTTEIEERLIKYENGEYPRSLWLDKLAISNIERSRNQGLRDSLSYEAYRREDEDASAPYYLYVELPNFDTPIVFSDETLELPPSSHNVHKDTGMNEPVVPVFIQQVEFPMKRVHDPDFEQASVSDQVDPIEMKYHKLERNINNNTILDKEVKPTPQIRDELLSILNKPSNSELSDVERNLIWRYRYYFSKNNIITVLGEDDKVTRTSLRSAKLFLTKFLKLINWDNDHEVDHVFNELIPLYWTVDKIQIGDALELLGNYFNPHTLTKNRPPGQLKEAVDEERAAKMLRNIVFLREFAVDRLKLASGDELLLYLLQLVQALKYESMVFSGASDDEVVAKSPLATFLLERSIENSKLGNFFYWFVKVENEDQLNNPGKNIRIYGLVLNKYIERVKKHSRANKLPNYDHLKRQIWFIKKLTALVELLRTTFKKNEATAKKVQFLREYLADSSNELLKFPEPFPLPLDPSVVICGCYPGESSVFKSSLAPLKITFKTIINKGLVFGKKNSYGKYSLMFKIGDDLRQDQLVIQIFNLMDQLLKNENLDLKLTPYKILATSPIAGLIQFVPNETLDTILSQTYPSLVVVNDGGVVGDNAVSKNGILSYLKLHSQELQTAEPEATSVLGGLGESRQDQQHAITSDLGVLSVVMDNYVKSCAGYCVITYLLGVGDRHLDNLLLSPNGKFWHADFGYILGRDPKPFPPLMKLPIQVIDGMGGLNHENFNVFKSYCFITYTTLRKNSNLILNLFQLMLDANIPDIQVDPKRAVEKVQEKFCLQMTEEEAILHFQNLINDSVNAFLPVVIDRLHSLAQYWRA